MTLSQVGFALRNKLAEAGIEVTPDHLEASIDEADERIQSGPDGTCLKCRRREREDGSPLDFRYGWCSDCGIYEQQFHSAEEAQEAATLRERAMILRRFQSRLDQNEKSSREQEEIVAEIHHLARYAAWLIPWREAEWMDRLKRDPTTGLDE